MILTLTHGRKNTNFNMDVNKMNWQHHGKKNIEEYTILKETNLEYPFDKIFIKRHRRKTSNGHDLLSHTGYIPNTPFFFANSQEDDWHYYIFRYLKQCQMFSDCCENNRIHHDKLINRELLELIIKNVASAFEEVNRRGFYYPDLCYENIMVDYRTKKSYLIDIDSCLPISDEKLATANVGSQTWWTLFTIKKLEKKEHLNQTMTISFALVLCQAISEIKTNFGRKINLAESIFRAKPDQQERLFNILDHKRKSDFIDIFRTPASFHAQIPLQFDLWDCIIKKMQEGQDISWKHINAFINRQISITGPIDPISEGAVYDVTIGDIGKKGDGMARIRGFVVFVPGTKIGDAVKIKVDRVKERYAFASLIKNIRIVKNRAWDDLERL